MAAERRFIIGVTGTPGTGKKSVGRVVADMLGYRFLYLNSLAFESGAVLAGGEEDFEVDPDRLRRYVLQHIKDGRVVLVGHLLPHILSKGEVDFVAVLRCSPLELGKRYTGRGYSEAKIRGNISSEILDICFADALNKFGADVIAEFDTTGRQPSAVAEEVVMVHRGLKKRSLGKVNWLSDRSAKRLIEKYLR
ncbi:MAG: adenylate kinase family protein [Nitrososphaerales archaeon]